jgi:cytochrome c peroxidase
MDFSLVCVGPTPLVDWRYPDSTIIDHRDVIDHYDRVFKMNPGLHVFFHSTTCCGPRRMNLSVEDRDALEAFLNTFTDEEFLADPKFSDPFAPQEQSS